MEDFHFPVGYEIFVPGSGDKIYNYLEGIWVGVSCGAFSSSLQFPLHSFYFEILGILKISLGQSCLNTFTQMCGFLVMCKSRSFEPRKDYFWHMFNIACSKEKGFYTFVSQGGEAKVDFLQFEQ